MSYQDLERVWYECQRIGQCMLLTMSERGMNARPAVSMPDKDAKAIWLCVASSEVGLIAAAEEDVCLAYADPVRGVFISINGSVTGMETGERQAGSVEDGTRTVASQPMVRVEPAVASLWEADDHDVLDAIAMLTGPEQVGVIGQSKTIRL